MKLSLFAVAIAVCLSAVMGFVAPRTVAHRSAPRTSRVTVHMGGKNAKFGPFSPAVYLAKAVLGEPELNKLRGKAIAAHSQAITLFCNNNGVDIKHRNRIIKKAKTTGDDLGFLV